MRKLSLIISVLVLVYAICSFSALLYSQNRDKYNVPRETGEITDSSGNYFGSLPSPLNYACYFALPSGPGISGAGSVQMPGRRVLSGFRVLYMLPEAEVLAAACYALLALGFLFAFAIANRHSSVIAYSIGGHAPPRLA